MYASSRKVVALSQGANLYPGYIGSTLQLAWALHHTNLSRRHQPLRLSSSSVFNDRSVDASRVSRSRTL